MSKKDSFVRMRRAKTFERAISKSVIKNNNFTKDEKISHSTCVFSERQKDGWLYCFLFKKYEEDNFDIAIKGACEFYVSKKFIKEFIAKRYK